MLVCEKRDFARNCWNIRASVKNLLYRGVYEVYKNDDSMAIFETSNGLEITLITYDCVNDMPEKDVYSLFINESDLYKLLSGVSPLDFDDSLKKDHWNIKKKIRKFNGKRCFGRSTSKYDKDRSKQYIRSKRNRGRTYGK